MKPFQKPELIEIIDNDSVTDTSIQPGKDIAFCNTIIDDDDNNKQSTRIDNISNLSNLPMLPMLQYSLETKQDEKPNLPSDYFPIMQKELTNSYEVTIMDNEPEITDIRILSFIKFCIKNKLFDDTFFDYNNVFSIMATKLNSSFNSIRGNNDNINKEDFIVFFKHKHKYKKDINFIYDSFDKDKKNYITWNEFCDFFLPFVRNVTM